MVRVADPVGVDPDPTNKKDKWIGLNFRSVSCAKIIQEKIKIIFIAFIYSRSFFQTVKQ